jgi:hypothetical protein
MNPIQFAATLQATADELRTYEQAHLDSLSRVTVRRKTGHMVQNESTGREVPEWEVVYTDLPFRLVPKGQRVVEIGGVEFSEATARGDVPFDTDDLSDDDYFDVTSGEWSGTALRLIEAVKGDQRTARRLPVVEVPRPGEWD